VGTRETIFAAASLIASAALSGCGGGNEEQAERPPAVRFYGSGSRLFAHVYDYGGGAREFNGWFDSELGESCRFGPAADGRLRCLPNTYSMDTFSDAGCTSRVRVEYNSQCPVAPRYAAVALPREPCRSTPTEIWRLQAEPATTEVYSLDATGCVFQQTSETYALDVQVDPSAFVAGDLVEEPRGERLKATVLRAEDGAWHVEYVEDQVLGVSCSPDAQTQSCWPEDPVAIGGFFADSNCSEPAGVATDDCATPRFVGSQTRLGGQTGCASYTSTLNEVGEPLAIVYGRTSTGACQLKDFPSRWRFYRVGAPFDPAGLAPLREEHLGTGRLAQRVWSTASHERTIANFGAWDMERERECSPVAFAGSSLRCAPPSGVLFYMDAWLRFDDPACTRKIVTDTSSAADCNVPKFALREVPSTCGASPIESVSELKLLGVRTEVFRRTDTGECISESVANESNVTRAFELGRAVDPSEFPLVTELTEN